ncbi:MAG: hypothetical protein WDA03_15065 [Trueperaceae bacterium]
MAFLDPYITLERVSDSASITIYGDAEFSRDATGNLSVAWTDPLKTRVPGARLTPLDLAGWLSSGVEQHRNRANAYLVITDPGGSLLKVTWREVDPWSGQLLAAQELFGVATLGSAKASVASDTLTLVVFRADYRHQRGSVALETRPGGP